jgi:hypothetical protein
VSTHPIALPARWTVLRPHAVQLAYASSNHRFNVVPAGRRSGKTERAKRKLVRRCLDLKGVTHNETPRYFAGAPTRDQAKRIFWDDLKALSRPWWWGTPSESELTIRMFTGAHLVVVGMDKPQRIEGAPWDGGVLDEYANMKPEAWGANVRPALSDRNGWCDLIGVPEGRNHYYDLHAKAVAEMQELGDKSQWGAYGWKSQDILPAAEIADAKRDLDPLTFSQEYEASFVNFEGRAYYAFADANKARLIDRYNPNGTLVVCLDFNVAPGVAVIAQEMALPNSQIGTGVIGEVWIEHGSNTPMVCRKILADWGQHKGPIHVYGDATGGAKGTAQTEGSDWDLVAQTLKHGDASQQIKGFGHRVQMFVKKGNPAERARVNAVNSRTLSADGTIRLMVDGARASHVVKDLEGVRTVKGGSGEIDKTTDKKLTHVSDALGYYIDYRFPLVARTASVFAHSV